MSDGATQNQVGDDAGLTSARLVNELLELRAAGEPQKIALANGSRQITYAELNAAANSIAADLLGKGFGRGDRLIVICSNDDQSVAALFGAMKAGGVGVPLHPATTVESFTHIIRDCEPFAVACHPRLAEPYRSVFAGFDIPLIPLQMEPSSITVPLAAPVVTADTSPALLIYTSGSTGQPKGVICPHRQILFSTRAINAVLRNRPDDVILCGLPLSFDYGLYQLFLSLDSGALLILEPIFQNPLIIPGLLYRLGVTGFPGVPSLFASLLRSGLLERMKFPKLRYLTSTGDVFPEAHVSRLETILPGVQVLPMYGLTECKRISIWPPDERPRRSDSVGKPLPGTRAEVVNEAGNILDHGEIGELVAWGPHLTDGYWNSPEETARRFRRDTVTGVMKLYTGDLFRKDADGYLYFVARTTRLIKSHGERVSPTELELYLAAKPGVDEACVVAVPDVDAGQALCAFLVKNSVGELNMKQIQSECRRDLRPSLCPKHIFVETRALPRNENGKMDRINLEHSALARLNLDV